MDAIVKNAIQQFCEENNILQDFQHGFRRGRSCLSNLLACLEIWTRALKEGFEVDVVYIDFRKAFDTVPHQRLLHKSSDIGIRGDLLNWIRAFLVGRKQRVCVGDDMSEWVNVTSGVPQGSVLGPLLFILYVNDSLQEIDCGKIMFADDVKLWQVIKGPNDQRSLQDNLHRLQAWSKKCLLDFNVEKCAVLHLRPTNCHSNESLRTYHLKDKRLPAESSQKDLGEPAVETIELLLQEKYDETENRLGHAKVIQLLKFCLKTFFTFDGTIYEQVKGTPMGSPISRLRAEAVLQRLKSLVFRHHKTKFLARYVDDTFDVIERDQVLTFKEHLNAVFPDIQFRMGEKESNVRGRSSIVYTELTRSVVP
nr:unnamed protein product [Spirometra erinaceieuropaei]